MHIPKSFIPTVLLRWFTPYVSAQNRDKKLISKRQIAELFGVSTHTIDCWLHDGKLPEPERTVLWARWDYEYWSLVLDSSRGSIASGMQPWRCQNSPSVTCFAAWVVPCSVLSRPLIAHPRPVRLAHTRQNEHRIWRCWPPDHCRSSRTTRWPDC